MIKESELESALKSSWNRESSSDSENWVPYNPAWGQCAVTALVVNDYLGGGEIVWAKVSLPDGRKVSHYFNKIEGIEKDFTRGQFSSAAIIPFGAPKTKGYSSTREYVLSYPATKIRYELLKRKVKESIKKDF